VPLSKSLPQEQTRSRSIMVKESGSQLTVKG
jgi:hypothetical protein